jgi:DNA-directed RNA polymerase specialized sigma24 family protein
VFVQAEEVASHEEDTLLTETAFARLLRWLDDGEDSHGARYMAMRDRLVAYFERRGRTGADALVDDTFNRIGRTLERSGCIGIRPPARYCFIVARFVFLEDVRRERRSVPFDDGRGDLEPDTDMVERSASVAERERRLTCLEQCLAQLTPDQRELVIEYYRGAKRQRIDARRELAARMGISMNALSIRMSRLRDRLEVCMRAASWPPGQGVGKESVPCGHN